MPDTPWYLLLGIIATVLTSLTVMWRLLIFPMLTAIWAAIKAAPQIPIILDDLRDILRSDVLGKLEAMQISGAKLEERLDNHDIRIADHEIRISRQEKKEEGA